MHYSTEKCVQYFMWTTRYACPEDTTSRPAENKTCTAINPATNQTINLQSLSKADTESPYRIKGPHGSEIELNICGKARGTSCGGDDIGICSTEAKIRAMKVAQPSTKLIWDDGVLAMVFTGGERCGHLGSHQEQNKSAIIHFVCPSAGYGTEAPMFVSQSRDDCEYRFVWPTELVCHQVLQCAHNEDGETYDLSALSSRAHAVHNIIDPGYQYFISVCRPLDPMRNYVNMHPNAAAVRVPINQHDQVESLGHVLLEPFTDFHNAITLIYINGSKCEYDKKQNNKARIIFECDYSQDAGEPVLVDIDNAECIYLFRWRTNLVCPGAGDFYTINPKEKCKFEIPQRGVTLDLTALSRKSPYQVRLYQQVFSIDPGRGPAR